MAQAGSPIRVVDLRTVQPAELDGLWQYEAQWWRERFLWDISDTLAALRRVLERGGVSGKAVRVGTQTVGYAYYGVAGDLGVLVGPSMLPEWRSPMLGEVLLRETIDAVRQQGVHRIESQSVAIADPWLTAAFERAGFRTYWREFLRLALPPLSTPSPLAGEGPRGPAPTPSRQGWDEGEGKLDGAPVPLESWQGDYLPDAAAIMQAAYDGSADAEINARYRTVEGCRAVLEQTLNQGSYGMPVVTASALARQRGQSIGLVVITETAPRQGHLAQVAVLPACQRQGVGRLLLRHSIARLTACHFDTLSLIVSRANTNALRLYAAMGWQTVLAFPAFVWDGQKNLP
jgi:ribosomal protein S18 acetylase RimI-like enzyme